MIASLPLTQGRQTLISAAIRYGSFPFDMITNAETSTTVQSNITTVSAPPTRGKNLLSFDPLDVDQLRRHVFQAWSVPDVAGEQL